MYQIKIKIIKLKGPTDKKHTVNRIYPDENMEQFAVLKNIEIGEMVLLHEKDNHFNLIISKDSDLAKFGSLSDRFKVGPTVDNEKETNEVDDNKPLNKYLVNMINKINILSKAGSTIALAELDKSIAIFEAKEIRDNIMKNFKFYSDNPEKFHCKKCGNFSRR